MGRLASPGNRPIPRRYGACSSKGMARASLLSLASCFLLVGSWLFAACGGRTEGLPPPGGSSSGDVGIASGSSGDVVGASGSALSGGSTGTGLGGSGTPAGAGAYGGSGTYGTSGFTFSGTFVGGAGAASGGIYYSGSGYGGTGASSGNPCNFPLPAICEFCGNGEVVCAHYAIRYGMCVAEICPPSSPPPPTGCMPGAMCSPGSGCGSTAPSPGGCFISCLCDPTGRMQCSAKCPPPPPPVCAQGAFCQPGTGCITGAPYPGGCSVSCNCDATGRYQCSKNCPPPPAPCAGLPLPTSCQLCNDGSYRCAHYVDVGGRCILESCPPNPVPVGCAQGASCVPNTGCGVGSPYGYGCFQSCWCDMAGQYECKSNCLDAGPPYPYFDAGPPPVYYDVSVPPYYDAGVFEGGDEEDY